MLIVDRTKQEEQLRAEPQRCRTLAGGLTNDADIALLHGLADECDLAAEWCRARGRAELRRATRDDGAADPAGTACS